MSALSPVAKALLRNPVGRVQGSGFTATVFGCTGTVGRYVCAELGMYFTYSSFICCFDI
jgi:hypothetical protein